MTVGAHESGGCAVMPCIQVLPGVEDDLGLWVRADELGCKDGPGCVGDGYRVPDERVEVGCCKSGVAVQGAEPSAETDQSKTRTFSF